MYLLNTLATLPAPITEAGTDLSDFWTATVSVLMILIGLTILAWRLLKRGTRAA